MEFSAVANKIFTSARNSVLPVSENKDSALNIQKKVEFKKADEIKADAVKSDTFKSEAVNNSDAVLHEQNVESIAKSINEFLDSVQTDLQVEIHRESHTAVFKIIRKEDQKVIRQVPAQEMLEIAANIEKMVGSLLNANA